MKWGGKKNGQTAPRTSRDWAYKSSCSRIVQRNNMSRKKNKYLEPERAKTNNGRKIRGRARTERTVEEPQKRKKKKKEK